jgi:hypothetical protein
LDFFESVQERKSIGEYQDKLVPREKMEKILEAERKVPDNFEVLVILAIGYARERLDLSSKVLQLMRSRKTLREVASEETFGNPLVPQKVEEP